MAKIFLSVVGTGDYEPTEYKLGNQSITNRFVQKSLLTMLSRNGEKFDRIVFFLTKQAKAKNWQEYHGRKKLPDGSFEEVTDEGLMPFLETNFKGLYEYVDIIYGDNEKEIFDLFDAMYRAIGENDEITFDITHGFRFIPFLFFPLISYAKELKNITIKSIYYGLFNNSGISEIIDLKPYDEILDCANAAHNFIHSGNASEMSQIIESHIKNLPVEKKPTFNSEKSVSRAIKSLTHALLTCQGGNSDNSIKPLADRLFNNNYLLNMSITTEKSSPEASLFYNLIKHATDSVNGLHYASTPYQVGMEAVRWYADRNLFLQAYTALRETITTFVCCIYAPEYDHCNNKFRESVADKAVNSFSVHKGKMPTDIDRMNEAAAMRNNPEYATKYVKIIKHIEPSEIQFVQKVVQSRNYMNHFGMNKNPKKITKEELEKCITDTEKLFTGVESRKDEILSDEKALRILEEFCSDRKGIFVNFSNHPSANWTAEQINAAKELCNNGEIIDIPFPSVNAESTEAEISVIANECTEQITALNPAVVMCMGEFGVCTSTIASLCKKGIRVVYSCSERQAEEKIANGETEKTSIFRFVRFREYNAAIYNNI